MHRVVRMKGDTLFSSIDMARYEREVFDLAADEHLGRIAEGKEPPSDEQLFYTFAEYGCGGDHTALGEPGPIIYRDDGTAVCLIPYAGHAKRFWFSARTWPPVRESKGRLVGRLHERALLLSAEFEHEFADWVPTAIATEIARIGQNLDVLAAEAERIDEDFALRARFMVKQMKRVWAARGHSAHISILRAHSRW